MKGYPLFILVFLFLGSCKHEPEIEDVFYKARQTIAGYLEANSETYSKFHRIAVDGDMMNPLSAYNPDGNGFTLFLPTDDAFDRYIRENDKYTGFEDLLQDSGFIRTLGRYHLFNNMLDSYEFPYGPLPGRTATGDILIIGYSTDLDSMVCRVNNEAPVTSPNLKMINGYIHIISEVLNPVTFSGYQWLERNEGYSILSQALEITGFRSKLGINKQYTILAEHDSIYSRYGINSIEDLIDMFVTPGFPYDDYSNHLYHFAGYHVLKGRYFLTDFKWGTREYNTYAAQRVEISAGFDFKINPGSDTVAIEISESGDTTLYNYIRLYYMHSNILTKTGPVHVISDLLYFKKPRVPQRTFQFYEEPLIGQSKDQPGSYYFFTGDQDELLAISWSGPESLLYYKSSGTDEPASSGDYLEIEGEFTINYRLPEILSGKYYMSISAHAWDTLNRHATVIVYLDGKRIGGECDLNTAGMDAGDPFFDFELGSVEFEASKGHTVTIESLMPGVLRWDFVRFTPRE